MKELLKNQLPKLLYGLIAIVVVALVFGLIIVTATLIMVTHGIIKVFVIIITILVLAWLIGNDGLS